MDAAGLRDAMSRLAAAVVVVAARTPDGFRGLTASTFVGVSLEPPLVLVALDSRSATRDAVVDTKAFNVSILNRAQEFIAERLAGRAPGLEGSWKEVPHRLGDNGAPIVDGCAAWFECRVVETHTVGDHEIFVGEVTATGTGTGDPLILWDRRFWTVR